MELIEPTFRRSLFIWWAFAWRSMVLWIPAVIVIAAVFFSVVPFQAPGMELSLQDKDLRSTAIWIMCVVMIVGHVVVQTYGMRWMLQSQRWADFFLALIPASDPSASIEGSRPPG
jgi:hypothetical protein